MKIRSSSYELDKGRIKGKYDQIVEVLRTESIMHSKVGEREQFLMPGGKIKLQLRKSGDSTFLDVTRTCLFEPEYVRKVIKRLEGRYVGSSCSSAGFSLTQRLRYTLM